MQSSTPCQSEPWTAERAVDFAEKVIELVRAGRNHARKDAPHIAVLLLEGGGTDAAMLRQGDPAVQERVTELNAIGGEFGVRFVLPATVAGTTSAYSSQWPPATAPWPGMSDEEQASLISEEADEIVERLRESPELRYELLAREPALRSLIEAIAALAPASK